MPEAPVRRSDTEVSPEEAVEILGISRPLIYLRMDSGKRSRRDPFRGRRAATEHKADAGSRRRWSPQARGCGAPGRVLPRFRDSAASLRPDDNRAATSARPCARRSAPPRGFPRRTGRHRRLSRQRRCDRRAAAAASCSSSSLDVAALVELELQEAQPLLGRPAPGASRRPAPPRRRCARCRRAARPDAAAELGPGQQRHVGGGADLPGTPLTVKATMVSSRVDHGLWAKCTRSSPAPREKP